MWQKITDDYDAETGEGFTTEWKRGADAMEQSHSMTPVFGPISISSVVVAKNAKQKHGIDYSLNMCDTSNGQANEAHFPVGEIVHRMIKGEENNWKIL